MKMGKHMKKRIGLIFAILLFSVLGFSACGDPYKKMSFSLSSDKDLTETVELYLSNKNDAGEFETKQSIKVKATVSGVGKGISTDVETDKFNDKVDIEVGENKNGTTTITFTAKSEGETIVSISPKENPDGKFTRKIKFKVGVGLTNFEFKKDAFSAISVGDTIDLTQNSRNFITFYPEETSQTDVDYEIVYPEGSSRDYAEIKDGVLYTYDSANYPTSGGVKTITIRATHGEISSETTIKVVDAKDTLAITTKYGDNSIALDKNNDGEYEIILANPEISLSGGSVDDKNISRLIHFAFGEDGEATSKYKVTTVGDYSYSMSDANPFYIDDVENEDDSIGFKIVADRNTTGTRVRFRIEYIGDESENGGDESLFEGLFTRYVTFVVKVFEIPRDDYFTINNSTDDQTVLVYDKYYTDGVVNNNTGTPIKISTKGQTFPNATYTITYNKANYQDGVSDNGLIMRLDGVDLADGATIQNGDIIYLRHNYSQLLTNDGSQPSITIKLSYSFAPSNATAEQKKSYETYYVEKKVSLNLKEGIKNINLENSDMGLDITNTAWQVLCSFGEDYIAKDVVEKIIGNNLDLIQIKYEDNKIFVRPNSNFQTGSVRLRVIANNGKESEQCNILVYLPVLYSSDSKLYIDLDEKSDAIFAIGNYNSVDKSYETIYDNNETITIDDIDYNYTSYSSLILASNSRLSFDVYSIMLVENNLQGVLPNVDVKMTTESKNVIWELTKVDGITKGVLCTTDASENEITITFTLSGYKAKDGGGYEAVTITQEIKVWVFDAIADVEFKSMRNEIVLSNALGYDDKVNDRDKFIYEYELVKNPSREKEELYGNFTTNNISLKNANKISHSISLTGANFTQDSIKKFFGTNDLSKVEITGNDIEDNRIRLEDGVYYFDIYNCDILVKYYGGVDEPDPDTPIKGYKAEITDAEFTIRVDGGDAKECTLLEILTGMYNQDNASQVISDECVKLVYNDEYDSNPNKKYRDFVLDGYVSQFDRQIRVETNIRMLFPTKVTNIELSVGTEGLYFEKEAEKQVEAQTISYTISPTDAYNKDITFKIFDENDTECNIKMTNRLYFTKSGDNKVHIGGIEYLFENNALYGYNEETKEYDKKSDLGCGVVNSHTIWVDVVEESYTGDAVATITVQGNKITISIEKEVVGKFKLYVIARDSIVVDEKGIYNYKDEKVSINNMKTIPISIGDGSYATPFEIDTIADLIKMWDRNISGQNEYCYKLTDHIDLSNNNFDSYIFNSKNLFKGDFDGNNKTINGLTASKDVSSKGDVYGGLFAKYAATTQNANGEEVKYKIHDLILTNIGFDVTISVSAKNAYSLYLGGLVGLTTSSDIENISVSGNINVAYKASLTNVNEESKLYVGGVTGCMAGGSLSGVAGDTTANVAILYAGIKGSSNKNHLGGAIGYANGDTTIIDVKVSGAVKAIENGQTADSDTYSNATIGGVVGYADGKLTVKDSRVTPTLSGYENIGGVVGDITSDIDVNGVVVEFLHNDNIKNNIMGYDNVGGFVGKTTANATITNSYIRSFVKDETPNDNYNKNEYCGNIIARGAEQESANVGGFIGLTTSNIAIESSYVMGDIKSYITTTTTTTENVGGFVGNFDTNQTATIKNAYFDGNIYSGKTVPNILFGNNTTPEGTNGSLNNNTIKTEIIENKLTKDKNVGEYIKLHTEKTEAVSYIDYTYIYDKVTISNIYARANGKYNAWTGLEKNEFSVRTAQGTIKTDFYLTFARLSTAKLVFTGNKVVTDYNTGEVTKYDLYSTRNDEWYEKTDNQTNFVKDDKDKEKFTDLGFEGKEVEDYGFVLNAQNISNPEDKQLFADKDDDVIEGLIVLTYKGLNNNITSSPMNCSVADMIDNIITDHCVNNPATQESVDKEDIDVSIEALYATEFGVGASENWVKYTIYGESADAKIDNNKFSVSFDSNTFDLYYNSEFYTDSDNTRQFSGFVIEDNPLYYDNNGYLTDETTIYYTKDSKLYTDEALSQEAENYYYITLEIVTKCNLLKDGKTLFSGVDINDGQTIITFNGKEYDVKDAKVVVGLNIKQLAKIYGFVYTNGESSGTAGGYFVDTDGNKIVKVDNDKYVSDNKNASWLVSDDINGGMPTLIKKIGESETCDKVQVLYDAVATMNTKVTPFNYNGSSQINTAKQGYVMLDEKTAILFYNTPQNQYENQNIYVLANDDEDKAKLDGLTLGGQAPIVVKFSDVKLNEPFELVNLHDYIVKSSNATIISVDKLKIGEESYNVLTVKDTGVVTLTFTNKYDDKNTFEITIYVVAGLTNTNSSVQTVKTFVNQTSTFTFGFENKLYDGSSPHIMNAGVGGYTLSVVNEKESDVELTYGGRTLKYGDTEEYNFDMSTPISIYGVKAGELKVKLVPYIKYGNNQKYVLEYMSQVVTIQVNDIAKDISTGNDTATTMKPEGITSFDVVLTSSASDENIWIKITDRDQNVVFDDYYSEENEDINKDLIEIYVDKKDSTENGNNLYQIIYTIRVRLNYEHYYEYYQINEYANPIEEALKYAFEFVPESWMNGREVADDYANKVAKYNLTIEPNTVSDIQTSFFNTSFKNNKYTIDTNSSYSGKMAPGKTGLLRLKVVKDFNNLSYVAVTTTSANVTLKQANATTDAEQKFTSIVQPNTAIQNGIKLWNMIYSSENGVSDLSNYTYANYYYVFVEFGDNIAEGSTVTLEVVAYGKNDTVLLTTSASVEVDQLPHVYFTNMAGETNDSAPIGEYLRVNISAINVDDTLTWRGEFEEAYEFKNNGFVNTTTNNNTISPTLKYKSMGEYINLPNTFDKSMLSNEIYIYVPDDCNLGEYIFTISGYKVINTQPVDTTANFTLDIMLFDIENITIDGAVGGVVIIPVGEYTTFSVSLTLNDYAQDIFNKVKEEVENNSSKTIQNMSYDEIVGYANSITNAEITSLEKYLFLQVVGIYKTGSGQLSIDGEYYNGWQYPDANSTSSNGFSHMSAGQKYPTKSENFAFFQEEFDGVQKYGISALKISNTNLRFVLTLKSTNGVLGVVSANEELYINKDFTLQITDNSSEEHPNPINTVEDFIAMFESMTEEQVNQEVSNNQDIDPSELNFGNYILLNDLTLENWQPRDLHVSSFDGNGFTITIKSWDFTNIVESDSVEAGLFRKIGEYTIVKNINVDISNLLSETQNDDKAKTQFKVVDNNKNIKNIKDVVFGVVAAENDGVITNVKVVSTANNGDYLNIWTKQGYDNGELCSAIISGFVAINGGSISDSFVGLNAVDSKNDGYSYIPRTVKSESGNNSSEDVKVYPFTILGGNKIAGFVHSNSGIITNSYVMGVSIKNQTNINANSMTAGFVNQNNSNATIYSCFASGSEYSEYGDDIVDLRATKTMITSAGNIGGFVYENQGTIENAYSMLDIRIQTVKSAGFAYSNTASGVIKNAYTTSTPSNIQTRAHGMFVNSENNFGTLENAYYLLLDGEMGITSTNKSQEQLKSIDPAEAIVSEKPSKAKAEGNTFTFNDKGSFEGFTFVSNNNSFDGIWTMGDSFPKLINTINYNIKSVRTYAGSSETTGTGSDEGAKLIYNYTYTGNPNIGSKENPIIISQPSQLAKTIVENSKKVKVAENKYIYLFGGQDADSSTYAPRYIRLVNNISLANISLNNTYKYSGGSETDKITLSKVVFDGYLIGNGMTISDIVLNNTSTAGNNLENFGLFEQIGLSTSQQKYIKTNNIIADKDLITDPLVYNVNFEYKELSDSRANKVGVLAGSVYGGSLISITIEGSIQDNDSTLNTINGNNLVGAVAGLIDGDVTMTDITIKNVKVNASKNAISDFSDTHEDQGAYYEKFENSKNQTTSYKQIEFDEDGNISNIGDISYAGAVAGVIIANNVQKENANQDPVEIKNVSAYNLNDYRDSKVKIHDIIVKENIEVSGDMAGGLFGYAKNTHVRNSYFMLMTGTNTSSSYQRIFGRAFGGGVVGQVENAILERVNIEHADAEHQLDIDQNIGTLTANDVSKNDLFLRGDTVTGDTVSVAIGGTVGRSKNLILLDSYSKVNVYNPKAKIAGGMIGYAEGKNAIGYSFTYGNVKAKEVVGGLIGFYRYNSFDLYLNNAIALNVWSKDVKDTLTTNLTAVYGGNVTGYDIRMPEIGNQMSEYSNNDSIEFTNKTNSITVANSRFVYVGSVLGKAVLNVGTYFDANNINVLTVEIDNNKLVAKIGNDSDKEYDLKNLFIGSKFEFNEEICAVPIFKATLMAYNTTAYKISEITNEAVAYNHLDNDKSYDTYVGDQFFNVFSTRYGVTTRTGSSANNDLVVSFSGLTKNDAEPIKTDLLDDDGFKIIISEDPYEYKDNTNAIKYSTIFGSQYSVAQIKGYRNSDNSEEYLNIFSTPMFTKTLTEAQIDGYVGKVGNGYKDLIEAINGTTSSTTDNNSWYYNESSDKLEYNYGQAGETLTITKHDDLETAFMSNSKGKTYTVKIEENGQISGSEGENYVFSETFRGVLNGDDESDKINIGSLNKPLFQQISGATINNLTFEIDMASMKDIASSMDSYGFFATSIINTTFDKCTFIFKNVPTTIKTYIDGLGGNDKYYNIENFGWLFGSMKNSTLTDCTIEFEFSSGADKTIKINNTAKNLGLVAGSMSDGSISGLAVNDEFTLNVTNGYFKKETTGSYHKFNSSVGRQTNVGTIVGSVSGTVSDVTSQVELKVSGAVGKSDMPTTSTEKSSSAIGGLFGYASGANITNSSYNNSLNVTLTNAGDNLSVGGVVGCFESTQTNKITNSMLCGSISDKGEYTDESAGKTFNVTITNNTANAQIYVGGVAGQTSSFDNSNNVINRVKLDVSVQTGANNCDLYVGGIIGGDTNNNASSKHSNMFNTGDITVKMTGKNSTRYGSMYVGGLIGLSNASVSDSYMQGDITVDGALNTYSGGLVGAIGQVTEFEKCIAYGDINYTFSEGTTSSPTSYFMGGIAGGYKGTALSSNTTINFSSCTVLASINEVKLDGSKYIKETANTAGNKYSSEKYSKLYISPFIGVTDFKYVNADDESSYIIEDYFDFYYAKQDKAGKYYYAIYVDMIEILSINLKDYNGDVVTSDQTDGNGVTYAFANHYFFSKNYVDGTKYSPKQNETGETIDGYNIVTKDFVFGSGINEVTINRGAVLAGNKTAGVLITGGATITNYGVVENIKFGYDKVVDKNHGVLNNVVAYGTNDDKTTTKLYGLVDDNYGYVYRSGALVVYEGVVDNTTNNVVSIGGLVYTNNNVIAKSYDSSMLVGLHYDKDGKITNGVTIQSGGIAFTNKGTIDTCVFDGVLYGGEQKLRNIAHTSSGKILSSYSDKNSTYYDNTKSKSGSQFVATIPSAFSKTSGLPNKNFGRYYVTGGIEIDTAVTYDNTSVNYFGTSTTNQVLPIFSLADYNRASGLKNHILLNDLYVGYENNMLDTGIYLNNNTFYGNKCAIVGNYNGNNASIATGVSVSLFSGSPNIYDLTIKNFCTTKPILAEQFNATKEKTIKNITIDTCYVRSNALMLGSVTKYTIKDVKITNTTLVCEKGDKTGGMGAIGTAKDCTISITNTNANYNSGDYIYSSLGGIVADATSTTFSSCTFTGKLTTKNVSYVGGIAGTMTDGSITGSTVKALTISSGANTETGGFAGRLKNATKVENCTLGETDGSTTITGDIAGGLAGKIVCTNTGYSATIDNFKTLEENAITSSSYAGGVVGLIDNEDITALLSFKVTIKNSNISADTTIKADGVLDKNTTPNISAGGFVGSVGDMALFTDEKGPNIALSLSSCTMSGSVESSYYAGGLVGYGYNYAENTNKAGINLSNIINNAQVVLSKLHYVDENNRVVESKDFATVYKEVVNNGWGAESFRFKNAINSTLVSSDSDLFRKKESAYWVIDQDDINTGGDILKRYDTEYMPTGFSQEFADENIKKDSPWYAPKTESRKTYNKSDFVILWSQNIFQDDNFGLDDSIFYSNMWESLNKVSSDNNTEYLYYSANMRNADNTNNIVSTVGTVFGGLYVSESSSTIESGIISGSSAQITIKNGGSGSKILIDRYVQWFYVGVEKLGGLLTYKNSGLMAIEYNLFINTNDVIGQNFCQNTMTYINDNLSEAKNHIRVCVSTHIDIYGKDTGSKFLMNRTGDSWNLSTIGKLNNEYLGSDLYIGKDGIIKSFYTLANKKHIEGSTTSDTYNYTNLDISSKFNKYDISKEDYVTFSSNPI